MKRDQNYNQLALISLGLTLMAALYYLLIFVFPQLPINPLPPVSLAALPADAVASSATPTPIDQISRPPTWTPTPPATPTSPRATWTPTSQSPTRTRVPTPTATLNPLIPTRSSFKFTANTPFFTSDPYGAACGNWGGVGGQVFNIDGSPLNGVSVVGWGGPVAEQEKKVSASGIDSHLNHVYGNGAYELYIGAPGDFDFFVTLYENGQPVAPIIKLRMTNDCAHDLVLINFQRNH
ncbi:MAG TPA: hypothetical protein VFF70_04435 [Anaerolineae bacterium]|nr:hypothetical protein [Anaerolineae bacterium]